MKKIIDLNADLGEGGTEDAKLLGLVSSANIACGGHAGSDEIMRRTVDRALEVGVAIGAHPGYEDREHFGRREMKLTSAQIIDIVSHQIEKLAIIARGNLHHVKLHGALYHQANNDETYAAAVIAGMGKISRDLVIYAPPQGFLAEHALAAGYVVWRDGFLIPRTEQNAVISEIQTAVSQAMDLAMSGSYETLCIHGDSPHAVAMLREIHTAMIHAGWTISAADHS
jgi:5-oxoprolinase (ATP-hydrolysing) subunit A